MSIFRELVLDTETTGFSPENGDKIVEIGIVELINHIPSGNHFHKYLNPERSVPESAFKVHGLNYDFLKTKPVFADIVDEMKQFIQNDNIIIHNASFDLSFLNNELSIIGSGLISRAVVIDTLALAREKFPGSPASLDALCRRFSIDNSNRDLHGALLDSYILAQVYLELIGGSQPNFDLNYKVKGNQSSNQELVESADTFYRRGILSERLTKTEAQDHKDFINKINGFKKWSIYR